MYGKFLFRYIKIWIYRYGSVRKLIPAQAEDMSWEGSVISSPIMESDVVP